MTIKETIGIYSSAVKLDSEFFSQSESVTKTDLEPLFSALLFKCDGLIKSPGLYKFTLQITKDDNE